MVRTDGVASDPSIDEPDPVVRCTHLFCVLLAEDVEVDPEAGQLLVLNVEQGLHAGSVELGVELEGQGVV